MTLFSNQLWKIGVPCLFDRTLINRSEIFKRSKGDGIHLFFFFHFSSISHLKFPISSYNHGREEEFDFFYITGDIHSCNSY